MKKTLATLGIGGALVFGGGITADQLINPYDTVTKIENGKTIQTLEIATASTVAEAGEVKNIVSTDEPKITLSKWNGEVSLGIKSLDLPSNTTGDRPFLSKNVEWGSGGVKMEAVPIDASSTMEDGGMEINIILDSQPASNVFTFQLENWQNLDFFYQPPLSDEEIKEGANRPDNVIGSYAVYYKDHVNHKVGDTNYATGKAYHIFRPLVTDNKGNTIWADMLYDSGVLSVTVPQDFLDNASYPVKVDPTFGYTTAGASQFTPYTSSTVAVGNIVSQLTASAGDTVTSFSGTFSSTAANGVLSFAVYSVLTGNPDTRLAAITSVNITSATKQLWTSSAVSQSLSAGTVYCVGLSSETSANQSELYYDEGSNPGRINSSNNILAASFAPSGTDSGRHYSWYATYTSSGAASTPHSDTVIKGNVIIKGNTVLQ